MFGSCETRRSVFLSDISLGLVKIESKDYFHEGKPAHF